MTEKRIYKPLPKLTREQVKLAIQNDNIEILVFAALSIATYDLDWKYAQDLCIQLSKHPHKTVRGNAVLALSYVARIHRRLEKNLAKPVLLNARKDPEIEVQQKAEDAIEDINLFMSWRIGNKHKDKALTFED